MRVALLSDIHLEFGPLNTALPTADIGILAGDITLLNAFDTEAAAYPFRGILRERTEAFLAQCRDSFARVFYLIGNHEAYGYNLDRAPKLIKRAFKGVELLENKAVDLGEGIVLAGCSLWTDMNQGRDTWQVKQGMNDFQGAIMVDDKETARGYDGSLYARNFRPEDAMAKFAKSKRFIARTAKAHPDKRLVVATHHAPSIQGINRQHVAYSRINAGYYTDLEAFIGEHPNILWWCHGHTHLQKRYQVAQCQVISNARGYIGQEHSADVFDPDCWFDPVTGAQSKTPLSEEALQAAIEAERQERALAPLENDLIFKSAEDATRPCRPA